jgi:hypothetical protein
LSPAEAVLENTGIVIIDLSQIKPLGEASSGTSTMSEI